MLLKITRGEANFSVRLAIMSWLARREQLRKPPCVVEGQAAPLRSSAFHSLPPPALMVSSTTSCSNTGRDDDGSGRELDVRTGQPNSQMNI